MECLKSVGGKEAETKACGSTARMNWRERSNARRCRLRDENRHLDIKREVNFRMSALIDRYWTHYGIKKRSASREKSILDGIRSELGPICSFGRLTATP